MAVAVMNAIRSAIQAGKIGVGAADSTTWVPLSKLPAFIVIGGHSFMTSANILGY